MASEALVAVPVTQREAQAFIAQHHRHHGPSIGSVFQVALARGDQLVGVAMIGRPVARGLDDGYTLEVTRLCTLDAPASRHAASKLYAICWRIAREMGYRRLLTYTLADETGISLVSAGWRIVHQVKGRSWDTPSRPRVDKHPTGYKTLWEIA